MTFKDVLARYDLEAATGKEVVEFMHKQFGMVMAFVKDETARDDFRKDDPTGENLKHLTPHEIGVNLSRHLKWDGAAILEATREALTDANFHPEAAKVDELLEAVIA